MLDKGSDDRGSRRGLTRDDRGITVVWTAIAFLFFTATAALAVDASGAFRVAQTDQNTADLACLAGVKEIPDSYTAGINIAYAYASGNWPEISGLSPVVVGKTATYADGAGNEIFIDAEYGGDDETMYVEITEISETSFGRTVGQDSIRVRQEAACSAQKVIDGFGVIPIGALAGLWNGDLFDCAAKITGNCGGLAPDASGANAYRDAVADGITGEFIKHHGNQNAIDPDTGYATVDCFAIPCNVSKTETGNMVGPWDAGLTLRFSDVTDADCIEAGTFNCDSLAIVLGESPTPLSGPQPAWWDASLYGDYALAIAQTHPSAEHYYYNGETLKCDSLRMATLPIVDQDQNWEPPDPASSWPSGTKDMKFIGFYTIYIREPSEIADLGGAMEADVIWFGPDSQCITGEAFRPFGPVVPVDLGVRLVAP